jgi:hypothetical protein
MRRAADDFDDQDLRLIHVAAKLKDALRLEQLLTDAGLDFAVEAEEYTVGMLLRRVRVGAFFYVAATDDLAARAVLRREGFREHPPTETS